MVRFKRFFVRLGRLSRKIRARKNRGRNFTLRVKKTLENFKYIEKTQIIKLHPNIRLVYNQELALMFLNRIRFVVAIKRFDKDSRKSRLKMEFKTTIKRDKYTNIRVFADNSKTLYENTLHIITFLSSNKYALIYKRVYEKCSNNHWFKLLKSPHVHKKAWSTYFKKKIYCVRLVVRFFRRKTFFRFCSLARFLSKNVYIQID